MQRGTAGIRSYDGAMEETAGRKEIKREKESNPFMKSRTEEHNHHHGASQGKFSSISVSMSRRQSLA